MMEFAVAESLLLLSKSRHARKTFSGTIKYMLIVVYIIITVIFKNIYLAVLHSIMIKVKYNCGHCTLVTMMRSTIFRIGIMKIIVVLIIVCENKRLVFKRNGLKYLYDTLFISKMIKEYNEMTK